MSDKDIKFKPCPFCASTDVEQDYGSSFVVCNGCMAAAKAEIWNMRESERLCKNVERALEKQE